VRLDRGHHRRRPILGERNRLFSSVIILSMSDQPKFDYGETVQVTSKEHNGRIGAVLGINGSESSQPTRSSSGMAARLTLVRKACRLSKRDIACL
jgi:hypothetical protein